MNTELKTEAYVKGWTAYYNGSFLCDNPYTPTNQTYSDWKLGFNAAKIKG